MTFSYVITFITYYKSATFQSSVQVQHIFPHRSRVSGKYEKFLDFLIKTSFRKMALVSKERGSF